MTPNPEATPPSSLSIGVLPTCANNCCHGGFSRQTIEDVNKGEALISPWSALPLDILKAIAEHLLLYSDQVRFYSTCKAWQPVIKLPDLSQGLPWLLLPYDDNTKTYEIYNLLDKKVYHLDLPKLQGKLYRGSSHGWIATVEDTNAIRLINPLTKVQVELPPRSTFPDVKRYRANKIGEEYTFWNAINRRLCTLSAVHVRNDFLHKLIMSSPPSSTNDYVAVAIYGEFSRLAYCKRGDRKWLHLDRRDLDGRGYKDIIFHEGKVYALSFVGELFVYELGPPLKVTKLLPRPQGYRSYICWYLVENCGEIFMVTRRLESVNRSETNGRAYKTTFFGAFKLDSSGSRWVKVTDIGDNVLFLGYNHSLSVPAAAFPECKGNTIYFTDDSGEDHSEGIEGGFDIGVFSFNDGSVEPLPGYNCESPLVWPSPVWVIPHPF